MTTDEEAEAFLEQDLSDLDFSQFKRVNLELREEVSLRLPVRLLEAVRRAAEAQGVAPERFMRAAIERAVEEAALAAAKAG
jgi:predicted DNA binding CopG/RHH family protein